MFVCFLQTLTSVQFTVALYAPLTLPVRTHLDPSGVTASLALLRWQMTGSVKVSLRRSPKCIFKVAENNSLWFVL